MLNDVDKILQFLKKVIYKYKLIIFIILIILIIAYVINYIKNDDNIENIKDYYSSEFEKTNENGNENIKESNEKIAVYITGQVKNPGVYYVENNSRVDDIVKLAGGVTDDANINQINLAQKVNDGEKIYVYKIGEEIKEDIVNNSNNTNSNSNSKNSTSIGKVNINTASVSELKTLNGIGDATANKIIDYRNKNGNFKSIEDIKNVNGIGSSKFNSIKDKICI